jgi:SecD/SecF fusion protein
MKAKGAVQWFTVLFTLICIYQLSFTWIASNVEKKAKAYAKGDEGVQRRYLDSIADKEVFNFLWIKKFTYTEVRDQKLNLGLDLQGGMNVVMEVDVVDVIKALSNQSKDQAFNKALTLAKERQLNSQADFVSLFVAAYRETAPDSRLAGIFATRENQGRIEYNSSDEEVIKVIRAEAESAIDRSFNILRTRIDKFGVTAPNIQRQQGSGRINIELPGVDNPDRVRKLLQGTAKLEFWETFEAAEVLDRVAEVNKFLAAENKLSSKAGNDTATAPDSVKAAADTATKSDNALLQDLAATDTAMAGDTSAAGLARTQKENPLFAILMPAVFQDKDGSSKIAQGPVVGTSAGRDTAAVNAILSRQDVRNMLPRNLKMLWTVKGRGDGNKFFDLVALKRRGNEDRAGLEGDVVTDARESIDPFGKVEVSMTMNAEGAKRWRRMTADNIGKSVAIVLDNYVYSFPTVQSEISGGMSSISGNFTTEEAKDLANILKAGKLPAPARIVEEAVVGPSLGKEAIQSGLWSIVMGLLLVLLFMAVYYAGSGLIANAVLFGNIFFIFGILASLQAVLTLPGLAGIVLTIGMAVDANVLIFERIREELNRSKSLRQAVSDGFSNAYSSIIDANVTTILTGIVLYVFGSGPIKGFATTLIVGILTSLFAALFMSRMIMEYYVAKDKKITFGTHWSMNLFTNLNYNFLGRRRLWYGVSLSVIVAGLISMFTQGFNLGVDFKGGRSYVVAMDADQSAGDLRSVLTKVYGSTPEVKTFGSDRQFKVTTTYKIQDNSESADGEVEEKLWQGLSTLYRTKPDLNTFKRDFLLSSQKVGPTIADDIKVSAIWSILFALIAIFVYIVVRFRKWQYALGATVALAHDVLVVLAVFTLGWQWLPFSLEIDQAFIAAILTIVGYSINDTVVVFDRLREDLGERKLSADMGIMNGALNTTLSRTLITSFTTVITVVVLFLFGGDVIKSFSFAILVGLIVGTYSSIFTASALVLDTIQWVEGRAKSK